MTQSTVQEHQIRGWDCVASEFGPFYHLTPLCPKEWRIFICQTWQNYIQCSKLITKTIQTQNISYFCWTLLGGHSDAQATFFARVDTILELILAVTNSTSAVEMILLLISFPMNQIQYFSRIHERCIYHTQYLRSSNANSDFDSATKSCGGIHFCFWNQQTEKAFFTR